MAEITITKKSNKALLWIVIIIVIILVGVAGYFYGRQSAVQNQTTVNAPIRSEASLETWDYRDVPPEIFPKDFPFESGTRLTESRKTQDKDSGDTTAHIAYYSKKPIGELINTFKNYLSNNGWTIINDTSSGEIYNLYARKGKEDMNIRMRFDPTGLGLRVEVDYLLHR
ncbi:MAG: hypothetical protein ACPLKV_02335 [Minisyncoccia bacterium]